VLDLRLLLLLLLFFSILELDIIVPLQQRHCYSWPSHSLPV
jgi:hypothetical protein